MLTLSIRAPHVPHGWLIPGFARIVSFVEAVLDVLADADRQASAARSPRRLMGRKAAFPRSRHFQSCDHDQRGQGCAAPCHGSVHIRGNNYQAKNGAE